jgi:DNA-binding HxlR family transcriptional regulator
MNGGLTLKATQYNVPVEATLEVIGGKWKVVILCLLKEGEKRFSELQRAMPAITKKMLSQQLKELEKDGMVNRKVYNEVPPKVEYSLSEEGETLREILNMMCAWGDRRMGNNSSCS